MSLAPHWRVRLLPQDWVFDAAPDQTVLQAALAAGFELPSRCRNGTCRACLLRLCAGQVRYRIEWPGLSAEEHAEGWILPCVAQARSDLVLVCPGAVRVQP